MTVYHRQGDGASSRIFRDRSSSRAQQCPLLTRMSYYISEKETKGPEGVCVSVHVHMRVFVCVCVVYRDFAQGDICIFLRVACVSVCTGILHREIHASFSG